MTVSAAIESVPIYTGMAKLISPQNKVQEHALWVSILIIQ